MTEGVVARWIVGVGSWRSLAYNGSFAADEFVRLSAWLPN